MENFPLYPVFGALCVDGLEEEEEETADPGADEGEVAEPPPKVEPMEPSLLNGRGERSGDEGASVEQAESGEE